MAQRHLGELLREEQEPFLLENFVEERRGQLQKPQPTKRVSVPQNATFSSNVSRSPLLIPINDHSTLKRSPLFDVAAKTPSSALKPTAYLILEAALRIQEKQKESKSRSSIKDRGFGFFASVLKRLVSRKRRCELQGKETTVSDRDICGRDSPSPGTCCTALQVTDYSEARPLPRGDISSFRSDGNEIVAVHEVREMEAVDSDDPADQSSSVGVFGADDEGYCSLRAADNRSAACSPGCPERERQLFDGTRAGREYDEEEQKEKEQQLSPVSVLDPAFAEEEGDDEERDHPEGHVDSFKDGLAIVLKAKQQIMHHLRRFERLAGLDPIQLDKLFHVEPEDDHDDGERDGMMLHSHLVTETQEIRDVVKDILSRPQSNKCSCITSIPKDITALILDLVREERQSKSAEFQLDEAALLHKVCRRFEAWKEVDRSALDTRIELDFTGDNDREWNKCKEQVQDIAAGIEIAIFELLVRELSVELIIY